MFVNLDNAEKREDSVKDIGALLDWVSSQPDLDSKRIAIWGGSYGGYMCLAGLVHFPDRFVCGIDNVGISNFVTFLENTAGRINHGPLPPPGFVVFAFLFLLDGLYVSIYAIRRWRHCWF